MWEESIVAYFKISQNDRDGRHDSRIQDRINLGRYAISTMNGILRDKRVAKKTNQHVYRTVIKYCIIWFRSVAFLKKNKFSEVEMDFWRRSIRASSEDKIQNHVIREKYGFANLCFRL
jgi:hypothetical protein